MYVDILREPARQRSNLDPSLLQRLANGAHDLRSPRGVAMAADRLNRQIHSGAIEAHHSSLRRDFYSLRRGSLRVGDQCPPLRARRQRAVSIIRPVSEPLCSHAAPSRAAIGIVSAPGHRDENDLLAGRLNRLTNGLSDRLILISHVIERSMRFDMLEIQPGGAAKLAQRADLVAEIISYLVRSHGHRAPPEPHEVWKRGMGADRHAMSGRGRHNLSHDMRITGVKPAGDVRRGDKREDRFIGPHLPRAEAFAHVTIQINYLVHLSSTNHARLFMGFRARAWPAQSALGGGSKGGKAPSE